MASDAPTSPQPHFVLPEEAERGLEVMSICVGIVAPQQVSSLVKATNAALGQPSELQHLKRVKRVAPQTTMVEGAAAAEQGGAEPGAAEMRVLLWAGTPEDLAQQPEELRATIAQLKVRLSEAKVPRYAPITRCQFDQWGHLWPLSFHPGSSARALAPWAPEDPLAASELAWMARQMRRAIELAEASLRAGGRPVGALICRPLGSELAACVDGSPIGSTVNDVVGLRSSGLNEPKVRPALSQQRLVERHPLQHAMMQCIATVAEVQRKQRDAPTNDCVVGAVGRKRRAEAVGAEGIAYAQGGIEGGVMCCSTGDKRMLDDSRPTGDATTASAVTARVSGYECCSGGGALTAGKGDLYLCNGCDAFVTVEPCAMCAMGLVHSRIRRLIYALPAAEGALGSKYRVHTVPSINHHFQVIRGFLQDEAGARLQSLAGSDSLAAG